MNKQVNDKTDPAISVKIDDMEMVVTAQSLADLCEIKELSAAYSDSISRIMKKVIQVGSGSDENDKTDYFFMVSNLLDMKEHYEKLARLQLMKDGEEVVPLE